MIKAKYYQQQPSNIVQCKYCGESFNNAKLRLKHHYSNPSKKCKKIREEHNVS